MSYVTPPNFVGGTVLTEANLDILSDDITDLNNRVVQNTASGCQLTRSTDRTMPADGSYLNIGWSSASVNVDGWWTAGSQIIVPAAAIPVGFTTIWVKFEVWVRYDTSNAGVRRFHVTQNGSALLPAYSTTAINGENTVVSGFVSCLAVVGDIFELEGAQSSGADLDINRAVILAYRLGATS